MKSIRYLVLTVSSVVSVLATSSAFAEQKESRADEGNLFEQQTPAVSNALELGVGAGYSQGVGDIAKGRNTVQDLAGPGGAVEVDVGYRLSPQLMIGVYGTGSQFARGDLLSTGTEVRSATAGVQANWHFRPSYTVDPWIGLSTGWRGMWLTPDAGESTAMQGLELARLQLGADYRISPEIAISPVIGADLSMYLTEKGPVTTGYQNITDPRVNAAFFGGFLARFDVLGTTSHSTASARTSATF